MSPRTCLGCGVSIDPERRSTAHYCPPGSSCWRAREAVKRRERHDVHRGPLERPTECAECRAALPTGRRAGARYCPPGTDCHRARIRAYQRSRRARKALP